MRMRKYTFFIISLTSFFLIMCSHKVTEIGEPNTDIKTPIEEESKTEKNTETTDYSGPPRLVKVEAVDTLNSKTKFSIQVEGKDIEYGSFFIRLDEGNPPNTLDFFKSENGYWYFNGGSNDRPTPNIYDNSHVDEDGRKGFFSHTFSMTNWPDSLYSFICGWHNRPQPGAYMSLVGHIILKNGKPYSYEKQSNVPDIKHIVVYSESGGYASFPELFVLDGEYKIGTSFGVNYSRSHLDGKNKSHRLISNDGGKTWKETSESLIDIRWKTSSGKLEIPAAQGWIFTDPAKYDELIEDQRIVMSSADGQIAYLGAAYVRTSSDNGKTWQSKTISIPDDCSGLMNHHTSSSYITTTSGAMIRAVYGRRKKYFNDSRKDEIYFIRSDDNGQNWVVYPMFESGVKNLEVSGFNETAILETSSGSLIVLMRSVPEGNLWQSESNDGGLTWSTPIKTPMQGYPASLLRLHDDRLLAIYGRRRIPMGIRATISNDDGEKWDIEKELIIRNDGLGNPSDLGYPVMHELPNNSIVCVYYITTDNINTHIASSIFKIPY